MSTEKKPVNVDLLRTLSSPEGAIRIFEAVEKCRCGEATQEEQEIVGEGFMALMAVLKSIPMQILAPIMLARAAGSSIEAIEVNSREEFERVVDSLENRKKETVH